MKTHLPARVLREHPDLDQLKRQAKELLAAFAAGEADAVTEVNTNYRGADAATFALHDAQLVLARSYGFDSWPNLKAYVDGATVKRLVDAVRAGDLAQVRAMLNARPELAHMDIAEYDEHQALHFAVLARAPEMVRVLMEHGANARKGVYPHRDAINPLTLAAERGYDEIVAIIEEHERRSVTVTPAQNEICDAILSGDEARAMAMLENDPALIDARGLNGCTPLHAAARTLNEHLVRWLLDRGIDANLPGPNDRTPLDVADGMGWRRNEGLERYPAVAALLRARGAALTARSAVALGEAEWLRAHRPTDAAGLLSVAVRHDRPEMLALLLEFGLDPDERTRLNDVEEVFYTWGLPLHHCAGLGKHAMAEMLLKAGADPNGQVYASGSVMYSAMHAGDAAMAELLERYGGVVDAAAVGHLRLTERARQMLAGEDVGDSLGRELLWAGLRGGDPEIVRMALEHLDWPRDDSRWNNMLWSALPRGETRTAEDRDLFLECFRRVLARCDVANLRVRRTVLHDVAALDELTPDEEVLAYAKLLLAAGARLDVRDDTLKSTPLGWACRWGRVGLVKLLLGHGADAVEADAEAWATPRAWARKMGHEGVAAVLA